MNHLWQYSLEDTFLDPLLQEQEVMYKGNY